jgi:hypothetical protein
MNFLIFTSGGRVNIKHLSYLEVWENKVYGTFIHNLKQTSSKQDIILNAVSSKLMLLNKCIDGILVYRLEMVLVSKNELDKQV